jgi:hypothetical protein
VRLKSANFLIDLSNVVRRWKTSSMANVMRGSNPSAQGWWGGVIVEMEDTYLGSPLSMQTHLAGNYGDSILAAVDEAVGNVLP